MSFGELKAEYEIALRVSGDQRNAPGLPLIAARTGRLRQRLPDERDARLPLLAARGARPGAHGI